MPILLYCVTEKSELPNLGTGVAGVPVLTCEQGELAALFSQGVGAESWVGTPLKASAQGLRIASDHSVPLPNPDAGGGGTRCAYASQRP